MPVRAVIFDLFDTLVDLRVDQVPTIEICGRSRPSSMADLHGAVATRSAVDLETFVSALDATDRELRRTHTAQGREVPTTVRFAAALDRLGVEDPELPEVLTSIHMSVLRSAVEVPAHHSQILAGLHGRVRIGLCSNFSHAATARWILKESGLREHLDAIAISEDVGVRKPRREIFQAVLSELECEADDALHVGDDLQADVTGAAALGMRTAWVTRRVVDPGERLSRYDGPAPDWSIRDLAELAPVLRAGRPDASSTS